MKDFGSQILLKGLLYWYIFIFISTEVFSYLKLLERKYILTGEISFWVLFFLFYRRRISQTLQTTRFNTRSTLFILILFLLTFIQGFLSAPNSADSMVYHLPRVMYWIQEKTLFQDTIRNVHDYMPPFGHYILLHLYLVFGNDRFLFFSQWIAYVVMVVISKAIAENLGANKQISTFASILVASIPVAVLQATSTTIDMIVTVFVIICTYLALRLRGKKMLDYLILGSSLGLGILTKQTFVFYLIVPLGILLTKAKKISFSLMLLMLVVIFVIQVRFIAQNLSLYGHIGGSKTDFLGQTNQNITVARIASNLIKNTMLHIPSPFFVKEAENVILYIHRLIGLDVNDCSITFCDEDFMFRITRAIYPQEDVASNVIHIFLIFTAGFIVIKGIITKNINRMHLIFYSLVVLSYIVFSAVVKWQPFHSRLHLPFFVLGTVSSTIILSKLRSHLFLLKGTLFLSAFIALILIFLNVLRPYISYSNFYEYVKSFTPSYRGIPESYRGIPESFIIKPRKEQYFNSRPYYFKPYVETIDHLKKLDTDGTLAFDLAFGFEYPFWMLIKEYDLNFRIIPLSQKSNNTIIISTPEKPLTFKGYLTECVKTEVKIPYSYVCISKPATQ